MGLGQKPHKATVTPMVVVTVEVKVTCYPSPVLAQLDMDSRISCILMIHACLDWIWLSSPSPPWPGNIA